MEPAYNALFDFSHIRCIYPTNVMTGLLNGKCFLYTKMNITTNKENNWL